jgi:stage IV sporulation protein FB
VNTIIDCPENRFLDWDFHILDVPVRVKIWFWVVILLIGGEQRPKALAIWLSVCFVSILLHELGHVFAVRAFHEEADVVLYHWGGTTIPRMPLVGWFPRVVVAFFGPLAGFCVAGVALLLAGYWGIPVRFSHLGFLPAVSAPLQYTLLNTVLWVNVYWGFLNLLPIYPFDGGHAAQAILGRRKGLILSAALAGALVLPSVLIQSYYLVLVFAILAVTSLQLLDSPGPQDRRYRSSR